MRKFLLLLILSPLLTFAQSEDSSLKAQAGEKTLELQLSPFGDNPIDINGIRVRWFGTDQRATRLNVFVGYDSDTEITQQEDDDNGLEELKLRNSVFTMSLRPGFENHINVSERLSPYFGGEFDFTWQTSSVRDEFQSGVGDVDFVREVDANGFIRLGFNAIAGMDYYIAEKLYLGTEFGFGFSYTRLASIKIKSDQDNFDEPDPVKQGSLFDLGPNVVAEIRLGYAF